MSIIVENLEIMQWQNTTSSPKIFLQKLNLFRERFKTKGQVAILLHFRVENMLTSYNQR